ncbi:hypothetical protein T261_8124 [Streptomyces lydicus]|nr:hypothetical protein T261_8124 [Streptomyces lydicus]
MVAAVASAAWAGAAAFLVCLVVRKVAPYPRWDLQVEEAVGLPGRTRSGPR